MKKIINKIKRFYYKIINRDPLKKCTFYKEFGCSHVDGLLCNFPSCDIYREYREHKDSDFVSCVACEFQEECCSRQFGLGCNKGKISNRKTNMKQYEIIFADLDGTLIDTISGETFPKGVWDMKINFDVLDTIKKLHPQYVLIVSNQGGIENGFVDRDNFRSKSEYIARAISEYCKCKCYGMYCETNIKSDIYRKPNTGMLENLLESYVGDDFDYIKQKSLMIGDASGKEGQFSDSDKKTAENFGIDYLDVDDFIKII